MKKQVKQMLFMLLCIMLAIVMIACSAPAAPAGSQQEAPAQSPVEPTSSSVKVESSIAQPIKVVFWHSFSGATGEALESIIKSYNEGRGKEKNTTVNLVFQGYEGTDKVILAYQTKDIANAPDINVGLTSTIPSLRDLSWSVPAERFLTDPNSEIKKDTFYPALQRSCTYQGEMVAIPFANSIPLLYYNIDLLKIAGFTEAPKTMDELVDYVKSLTVKEGDTVSRYGLNMQNKRYQVVEFCVSQRADAFFGDNEGGRTAPMTRITADENGTLRAYLEKLQLLLETGGYKYVEDKINEEFAQELSAMVIMSSSRMGTLDNLMPNKYMTSFLPKVNASDDGGAAVGGSALYLFNRGDELRLAAAWDVIQYIVSPENQAKFSQVSGYIPVNVESENLPEMKAYYTEKPQYKVALDQMKASSPNAQEPLDLTYNEINGIITEVMMKFCQGELDIDAAISEIAIRCNASLDEYHAAND